MDDAVVARLTGIVGAQNLLSGDAVPEDYARDEALTCEPRKAAAVAKPASAREVSALLAIAAEHCLPVTARGSGSGLSGAARPREDGLLISFERMNSVLEVDVANQVAVVQPGVTLAELDQKTAAAGLAYTVYPGELSASVGGNVGTNAGGMRAVKYGVTRNNVLGLEAVLPTGEIIRTGGKTSKISSGYDLTQLIIGSEGTLAVVTEVTVKLYPRLKHSSTLLAPFGDLDQVMAAVPEIIASGLTPNILEYIDNLTMAAITHTEKLSLGISDELRDATQAYLVVGLENRDGDRLEGDLLRAAELLSNLGASDVFVLDGGSARKLVEAREKAFWTAKAAGADDVIDVVVPRSEMPGFLARARKLAAAAEAGAVGCGHAGDGNVHLAIFCKDPEKRNKLLRDIFFAGIAMGGAISGEHGIGQAKKNHFLALEDPAKVALLRRIKQAFDPKGILNPDVLLGAS
ncbi:MAG TPA: FAD-linked oxidase C-terminal domain-containing protein [Amycolatopsis sp.]|uniref:FAD-binding oxidoreductase n=1 Tax=Amycolatopsis sp. TaxID=37632 RepID=UPI002B470999|nr:FAD-linked oxidase C-terminal domain-containing protein [Amycolatopsis sp.]HKS44308.1 FAD-linked oxidase C-terminal domain-containing protein [Amycolatopsis sp.]